MRRKKVETNEKFGLKMEKPRKCFNQFGPSESFRSGLTLKSWFAVGEELTLIEEQDVETMITCEKEKKNIKKKRRHLLLRGMTLQQKGKRLLKNQRA